MNVGIDTDRILDRCSCGERAGFYIVGDGWVAACSERCGDQTEAFPERHEARRTPGRGWRSGGRGTTPDSAAGAALLLGGLVVMALLPVWAPIAAVWLLATGRSLRSCNREANRMSGVAG